MAFYGREELGNQKPNKKWQKVGKTHIFGIKTRNLFGFLAGKGRAPTPIKPGTITEQGRA
uniref:Uncharacterized protein n=1 Tax=Siphoviridae sp. ct1SN28 TaxID=2825308 RepID=A0A8S5TRL0_9CAUD|nr:MAG TPA: hypothetical protein [Siphoviridae sp. ct1SN28]